MSANVRIKKLEALLGKIGENAGKPRAAFASPVSAASAASPAVLARVPAPTPELELDEPTLDEGAPDSLDGDLEAKSAAPVEVDELDLDAPVVAVDEVELDDVELEEPPESGSAPVADPIGRAIAEEDDARPLTPPPESGPEPAKAPQMPIHGGPTMEQLGQTIQLEEGPETGLEVDEPIEDEMAPPPKSHLEMELPSTPIGTFDQRLSSPPEARAELERVRLGQTAEVAAHVVDRPVLSTNVVDFVGAHASVPDSFLGWLDTSLEL